MSAPSAPALLDTAAIMQNHGLTHIISSDVHFDLVAGLTRLDPLVLYQTGTQSGP